MRNTGEKPMLRIFLCEILIFYAFVLCVRKCGLKLTADFAEIADAVN